MPRRKPTHAKRLELFTRIAREHLSIETLETRRSDSLDFHDVSVWGVVDALDAAYRAGQKELLSAAITMIDVAGDRPPTEAEWQQMKQSIRNALKSTEPRP